MSDARDVYREAFQHFASSRLDEAIAGFERAVEIDPSLALAWNALSMAQRQKGDLDAAIEAALRLVELEPEDPLSHTNLSILYQTKGMIPEAEDAKARAMQLETEQRNGE